MTVVEILRTYARWIDWSQNPTDEDIQDIIDTVDFFGDALNDNGTIDWQKVDDDAFVDADMLAAAFPQFIADDGTLKDIPREDTE
ncbi:MAG: hypothetical protein ACPG7F_10825 [Aggregatilineales bacterium]